MLLRWCTLGRMQADRASPVRRCQSFGSRQVRSSTNDLQHSRGVRRCEANTTWALYEGWSVLVLRWWLRGTRMAGASSDQELDAWLAPFLAAMGRKTRRHWAPLYLRGLLGPGDRKSLQPMAARLGLSGHDQLQHFIASPAWDDAPCWRSRRIGWWVGRRWRW